VFEYAPPRHLVAAALLLNRPATAGPKQFPSGDLRAWKS
jgi:hypothetical protein